MGRPVYVAAAVQVAAPPEQVFALITDWPRHQEWMFLTTARQAGPDTIEAYTGVRPFGFLDTMTITHWRPPALVRVEHTGRIVRGRGAIRVLARAGGSRVVWAEELWPPFGLLGRVVWPIARLVSVAFARRSLRKLAVLAERDRD
ncbi:polyketide cyclase/dehydrase/lipid transport protein [Nonomuraea polychroma]|uniref:Polyketide cyclase/dehydrase/lipid transport protein n=1 Tax=Nonomuraea polychroma TaxID=46176 RepID=A0A438M561_9ACTN|nr:SRPBCC family protein [Nonomuraea polychroma]RVX40791.1 polyketide cyclase/dehydrase/lipid transport protein [Nonomuraea polychroma]